MRAVSAKAYQSRGCLCFCAYSATITDTKIPRVLLRFTLGYVLLPLQGVATDICTSNCTLLIPRVPLQFTLSYALLPLRGVLVAMCGMAAPEM